MGYKAMDAELLKTLGLVVGIGGIALGVFLLIFRDVVRRQIFGRLNKESTMALNVYLDTNVFDHILKKIDFTDADVQLLKNAISDGKISISRSVTLVEEILPAINASDPELANRKKQLLMELTDPSKLVKNHTELLRDDINAFVNGTALPSPFTDEFPNILDELTPQASEVMVQKEVLRQTKEQKELVKQGFKDAKKESLVAIESGYICNSRRKG